MHISQLFQKAANLSSTLFVFSGTKKELKVYHFHLPCSDIGEYG